MAAVDSPVGRSLQTEGTPTMHAPVAEPRVPPRLRTLSGIAYTMVFGAIWGFATFGASIPTGDGATSAGLAYLWIALALAGSVVMVAKSRLVADRAVRATMSLAEFGVVVAGLLVLLVVPAWLGLVRSLILLVVFGVYYFWYARRFLDETIAG